MKIPQLVSYPKELGFAFQDVASTIAAVAHARAQTNVARGYHYNRLSENGWSNPEYDQVFKLCLAGVHEQLQMYPGKPAMDCIREAVETGLTLHCGKLVLLEKELKDNCPHVIVSTSMRNQEALQSLINKSNQLFEGNNMYPQPMPGYPQQTTGYPQQVVQQQIPVYQQQMPQQMQPFPVYQQPMPGYPQQQYVQQMMPQQMPMYQQQMVAQQMQPSMHGQPMPGYYQAIDGGNAIGSIVSGSNDVIRNASETPAPVKEQKPQPVPAVEKQRIAELDVVFEGNEMNRDQHTLVLMGRPFDPAISIKAPARLEEDVMQMRRLNISSQDVRDGKSPLLELKLDVYFTDPVSIANIARSNATVKNETGWGAYRVFCTQPHLLSLGADLSGISGQIYAENTLDETHARFSLLQDSINAMANKEDTHDKLSALLAVNNHITKTINRSCMELGLCPHANMIDSFVEDWKDLKRLLANENAVLSTIENNYLTMAQSVVDVLKNDINCREMTVGVTAHSVTVVNITSLGLGYKIKPLDGFLKVSRTKTPLLLHVCNNLKTQAVSTENYVQHHWMVTSDNVVYELLKNAKMDEWLIRML